MYNLIEKLNPEDVVSYDKHSVVLRVHGELIKTYFFERHYADWEVNKRLKESAIRLDLDYLPHISKPKWASNIECIIKRRVLEDLIVDDRPDFLIGFLPDPEKFKEIGGYIVRRSNGQVVEWSYTNKSYLVEGEVVRLDTSNFEEYESGKPEIGDKVVFYHTHPNSNLFSNNDIKSGPIYAKNIPEIARISDFYSVLYIPKLDYFYWIQYKKFKLPRKIRQLLFSSAKKK